MRQLGKHTITPNDIHPNNTYSASSTAYCISYGELYCSFVNEMFGLQPVHFLLLAVRVLPGSSIEDVSTPISTSTILHVVALGPLSYQAHSTRRFEIVGRIYQLDVLDVTGLAEPFLRKVSTTHLCGCLASIRWRCHLASPLDRGSTTCQPSEDRSWPVA